MYSCTIVVPHVDTPYYLKFCLEQIRKYENALIKQKIVVVDQSSRPVDPSILEMADEVIHAPQVDAGYPIDLGVKAADTEYFCTLDCDAFPLTKNWLLMPILQIKEYGFSFVGANSGLEQSYKQKGAFFHINNYFRVSKTSVAKEISEAVGFMRPNNRGRVGFTPQNNEWGDTACDNGVIAQWYADQKGYGPKLNLPITSYAGVTPKMGVYGMVIDDLMFHMVFGFGQEWIDDMQGTLGAEYLGLRQKIMNGELTEELIQELIAKSTPNTASYATYRIDLQPEMVELAKTVKGMK